jgi:AcrR family transcriptional regulator
VTPQTPILTLPNDATILGRLIDALETLIASSRFRDLSAGKIARHAGLSRATFYRHFATKADLLIAAIVRDRDHGENASCASDELSDLGEAVVARMGRDPTAIGLLRAALEAEGRDPRIAQLVERRGEECLHFWITYARRAHDLGRAVDGDPRELGALVDRFVQANAFAAARGQVELNDTRLALIVEAVTRMLLRSAH